MANQISKDHCNDNLMYNIIHSIIHNSITLLSILLSILLSYTTISMYKIDGNLISCQESHGDHTPWWSRGPKFRSLLKFDQAFEALFRSAWRITEYQSSSDTYVYIYIYSADNILIITDRYHYTVYWSLLIYLDTECTDIPSLFFR